MLEHIRGDGDGDINGYMANEEKIRNAGMSQCVSVQTLDRQTVSSSTDVDIIIPGGGVQAVQDNCGLFNDELD